MKIARSLAPALVLVAAAAFSASAVAPARAGSTQPAFQIAQAAPAVTYADVSPIFESRCVRCHSGPKPPEALRLDSYENLMKGGKNGAVVQPGAPQKSDIVKSIKGIGKTRMPRNGPPWLSDADVALIEKWIAAGAPK